MSYMLEMELITEPVNIRSYSYSSVWLISAFDFLFLAVLALLKNKEFPASLACWTMEFISEFYPTFCRWWRAWYVYYSDTEFCLGQNMFVSWVQLGCRASYSHLCRGYLAHVREIHHIYCWYASSFLWYGSHCGAYLRSDQYQSLISYCSLQYCSKSSCLVYWWPTASQFSCRIWGTLPLLTGCDYHHVRRMLPSRFLSGRAQVTKASTGHWETRCSCIL